MGTNLSKNLLISTIATGAILAGTALSTSPTWARSYTTTEIIANKVQLDLEADAECSGELVCEQNFYKQASYTSNLNYVTREMNERMILVTSINPSTLTVKVYYNWRTPHFAKRPENEDGLHYKPTRFEFDWLVSNLRVGPSIKIEDPNLITPEQEVEVTLPYTAEPKLDLYHEIDYWVYANDNKFNHSDSVFYNDCLASPDYHEGMECRLAFRSDGKGFYSPVEPGEELYFAPDPVEVVPSAPEPDLTSPDNIGSSPDPDPADNDLEPESSPKPDLVTEPSATAPSSTIASQPISAALPTSSSLPLAPNTGIPVSGQGQNPISPRAINLLHWTLLLVILNALLSTYLWRNHHKNH